jgi:hypothetical protein
MNAHAERWSLATGTTMQHDVHTAGIVQPTSLRMFPDKSRDEEWHSICFCRIFLCRDQLTYQIVTHECLHVAMCYMRHVDLFDMHFDLEIDDDEERLCHYHGRAVEGVLKALKEKGCQMKRMR